MNTNQAAQTITTIEAGFVRLGETLSFGGGTLVVAEFELGPEHGEVSFFGPSCVGLRGERYIFNMSDHVDVASYRPSQWEA